jgi:hypothetical protein
MKFIILSSLTVLLTLTESKDHIVALRGAADQIPTFEYVDLGASIQCNGPNASRPCPEGKPLPYSCDDGAQLCCIVKPKGKEDLMSEVDLVPYGTCRAEESVEKVEKVAVPRPTSMEFVDLGASIQCNGPNASRPCPEGKPLPYSCDDGAQLCCIVKPKGKEDLMSEVDLVPYGTCRSEESVEKVEKVAVPRPTSMEFVDLGASIQCNGPNASRPCPEGKPLPYSCDDGAQLCCIVKPKGKEDLMSEVDLAPYGTCRAEDNTVEITEPRSTSMEFVDLGASIQCNGPNASRPCSESKPLPYFCQDGSELCCVVKPEGKEHLINEVDLSPYGKCTVGSPIIAVSFD